VSPPGEPTPVTDLHAEITARLNAARRTGEIIIPILPRRLGVSFWPPADPWPPHLAAGVLERSDGYRHRPENVCLVSLLKDEAAQAVVELGAGSGSLLLAAIEATGAARAAAVERQPEVAARLGRTFEAHRLELDLRVGDLRQPDTLAGLAGADLVVANPPFFPANWGRPSSDPEVHASTHALHGSVFDFLAAAAALLAPAGVAWFVYDATRTVELLAAAGDSGLEMSRLVWIPDARPSKDGAPTRVWVRFVRKGGARIDRLGGRVAAEGQAS
jgi:tRNA1(Val) A37 N6-methylase TrmN6